MTEFLLKSTECTVYSHNPEWMVSKSQELINNAVQNNQPFFLYFASTLTHDPPSIAALQNDNGYLYTPKGELTGDEIPTTTGMRTRSQILNEAASAGYSYPKNEWLASYLWMDESFGALIDYLEINNLYNDTFIIFTNDHGMAAKGMVYEQGSRIIQFVRYPPLFGTEGKVLSNKFITSNIDVAATIYEVAGITNLIDDNYANDMDSISWIIDVQSAISGQLSNTDTPDCCTLRHIDVYNSHAIVTNKFKYIYRATLQVETDNDVYENYLSSLELEQIYNLNNDPSEQINKISANIIKDDIFDFRIKMIDYILDIACDVIGCYIPTVTYIPIGSTWSEPTAMPTTPIPTSAPTLTGYNCYNVVNYTQLFRKVSFFDEITDGPGYLDIGEQTFLSKPLYDECGTAGQMEYFYKFLHFGKLLTLDMLVCCAENIVPAVSFGLNYPSPIGYQPNSVIQSNLGIDDFFPDTTRDQTIRNIIVLSVLGVICICVIIGFCLLYRKHKNKILNKNLDDVVNKNQNKKKNQDDQNTGIPKESEPLTPLAEETPDDENRDKVTPYLGPAPPTFSSYNVLNNKPIARESIPSMSVSTYENRTSDIIKNRISVNNNNQFTPRVSDKIVVKSVSVTSPEIVETGFPAVYV